MTLKQNLLTGTDETQVTPANSTTGGDAFSTVAGSVVYDTGQKMHGTTSARFAPGNVQEWVSYSGYNTNQGSARAYLFFPALPTITNQNVIQILNGSTWLNGFDYGTDGRFSFRTPVGGGYYVSPGAISLNTWYRVEMSWSISATNGSVNCKVFLGDSTTPLWSVNPTGINTGTLPITEIRVGSGNSNTGSPQFWVDEFAVQDGTTALIGPYTSVGPTVNATASVSGTTISLGSQVTTYDNLAPSYLWTQTAGPAVTLSSRTVPFPTVGGAPSGDYTFSVQVTDSAGATATNSVSVTVASTGGSLPPSTTTPTAVVSMYHDVFVIDATKSVASTAGGTLSYTITPSAGLTTLRAGIWVGLSPSVAATYTVQVNESGASPAVSTVTVPAKPSASTGGTTGPASSAGIQILVANADLASGGVFS